MQKQRTEHLTKEYLLKIGLVIPERECKGCGVVFQPSAYSQRFHDAPCREDATVRSRLAKALEKSGWKTSERKCKGCGVVFQPLHINQTYHNVPCREDATVRNQLAIKERKKASKARTLAQKHEKERLEEVEHAEFKKRWLQVVVGDARKRKMEPLMALAEEKALAEGYEFVVIPDEHPRWASPEDLRRSSAMNTPGAVMRDGSGSWWDYTR